MVKVSSTTIPQTWETDKVWQDVEKLEWRQLNTNIYQVDASSTIGFSESLLNEHTAKYVSDDGRITVLSTPCLFDWNSNFTWDQADSITWNTEGGYQRYEVLISSPIEVGESLIDRAFSKCPVEEVLISDGIAKNKQKTLIENFLFEDSLSKHSVQIIEDGIILADENPSFHGRKALSDGCTIADSVGKQSLKALFDAVLVEEFEGKGSPLKWTALENWKQDGLSVEKIDSLFGLPQWELTQVNASTASVIYTTTPLEAEETITYKWIAKAGTSGKLLAKLSDVWRMEFNFESQTLVSSAKNTEKATIHKATANNLGFGLWGFAFTITPHRDIPSDDFGFGTNALIGQTVTILGGLCKAGRTQGVQKHATSRPPTEVIPVRDLVSKEQNKHLDEALAASDAMQRMSVIGRNIEEQFFISDDKTKTLTKSHAESLSVADALAKTSSKALAEHVGVGEAETDPSSYFRGWYESILLGSSLSKQLIKPKQSELTVKASMVLPFAPGVISDVAIKNIPLTPNDIEEYINSASAFGFTNWAPFADGEYYYREALIRMIIYNEAKGGVNGIVIPHHKIICDVYDMQDRGTGMVNTNPDGTFIAFNKKFRDPKPIVTVTSCVTTQFAVPSVLETNSDGFKVLLRAADGSAIQGQVNWVVDGY